MPVVYSDKYLLCAALLVSEYGVNILTVYIIKRVFTVFDSLDIEWTLKETIKGYIFCRVHKELTLNHMVTMDVAHLIFCKPEEKYPL